MSTSASRGGAARPSLLPSPERRERLRKARMFRDGLSRIGVAAGGLGVIFALALIFLYLFYETLPLLKPPSMAVAGQYTIAADGIEGRPLHLTLDRYEQIGARFSDTGQILFFDANNGARLSSVQVPVPEGATIVSFGHSESRKSLFVYGNTDGSVLPLKLEYALTYPDGQRVVTPRLTYPLGEVPLQIAGVENADYSALTIVDGRGGYVVAGGSDNGDVVMAVFSTNTNLLTGDTAISRQDYRLPRLPRPVQQILVNESLRNLFAIDDRGMLYNVDIADPAKAAIIEQVDLTGGKAGVTAADFLVGSRGLIVGAEDGSLREWFLVRDEASGQSRLTFIREFEPHAAAVTVIEPEYSRKGFMTGDASGEVALHYATSSVTLRSLQVAKQPITAIAISPIDSAALVVHEGSSAIQRLAIDNPHPQTSISSLWGKVWYEGRDKPEWIWQSSSADDAFESKFSLVPLTTGTLKAALFAMLLSMPIAIMGAIYTAYFMSTPMRRIVKPSIELMEALPTVILGFLAGIWLAPFIENHLPILVTGALLIPLGTLFAGFAWSQMPAAVRHRVPAGWEAALLIPVIVFLGWITVASSPWIEVQFFHGSMRQWLTDIGVSYDQRNALIVGLAMGFAVIPTIFSIAEDAVFSVPKHLTQGSLALGATRWQTVMGVVLLTASPGIFSAVMIGLGRAVGETMIVLMASGNSPIVNFNIFEGMRTLAANVAVELPETAVGSTHFRVLFLSSLVLLAFTFLVNTIAEMVRQRLRARYASL